MPIIYVFIYFFGLWTLLCNAAVLCGFNLYALERLFPVAVIFGIVCGLLAARPAVKVAEEFSAMPADSGGPCSFNWLWILAAMAIVALRLHNGGYFIFWIMSVLFLAGWLC